MQEQLNPHKSLNLAQVSNYPDTRLDQIQTRILRRYGRGFLSSTEFLNHVAATFARFEGFQNSHRPLMLLVYLTFTFLILTGCTTDEIEQIVDIDYDEIAEITDEELYPHADQIVTAVNIMDGQVDPGDPNLTNAEVLEQFRIYGIVAEPFDFLFRDLLMQGEIDGMDLSDFATYMWMKKQCMDQGREVGMIGHLLSNNTGRLAQVLGLICVYQYGASTRAGIQLGAGTLTSSAVMSQISSSGADYSTLAAFGVHVTRDGEIRSGGGALEMPVYDINAINPNGPERYLPATIAGGQTIVAPMQPLSEFIDQVNVYLNRHGMAAYMHASSVENNTSFRIETTLENGEVLVITVAFQPAMELHEGDETRLNSVDTLIRYLDLTQDQILNEELSSEFMIYGQEYGVIGHRLNVIDENGVPQRLVLEERDGQNYNVWLHIEQAPDQTVGNIMKAVAGIAGALLMGFGIQGSARLTARRRQEDNERIAKWEGLDLIGLEDEFAKLKQNLESTDNLDTWKKLSVDYAHFLGKVFFTLDRYKLLGDNNIPSNFHKARGAKAVELLRFFRGLVDERNPKNEMFEASYLNLKTRLSQELNRDDWNDFSIVVNPSFRENYKSGYVDVSILWNHIVAKKSKSSSATSKAARKPEQRATERKAQVQKDEERINYVEIRDDITTFLSASGLTLSPDMSNALRELFIENTILGLDVQQHEKQIFKKLIAAGLMQVQIRPNGAPHSVWLNIAPNENIAYCLEIKLLKTESGIDVIYDLVSKRKVRNFRISSAAAEAVANTENAYDYKDLAQGIVRWMNNELPAELETELKLLMKKILVDAVAKGELEEALSKMIAGNILSFSEESDINVYADAIADRIITYVGLDSFDGRMKKAVVRNGIEDLPLDAAPLVTDLANASAENSFKLHKFDCGRKRRVTFAAGLVEGRWTYRVVFSKAHA